MRKLLTVIVFVICSVSAYAQTIGGLSIGQSTSDVKKEYGKPDKVMAWSNGPDFAWEYDFGPKLKVYVVYNKTTEQVVKLVAMGDLDRRGVFQSRLGVRVGDTQQKVIETYGVGEIVGEDSTVFSRRFPNIQFTFRLSEETGAYYVNRVEVFPTPKKPIKK